MYNLRRLPPTELLLGFEAVARSGQISSAARELSLTQGAVSKQIRGLEDRLQLDLFERHPRGLALTPAGQELLETVQPLLHQLGATLSRLETQRDQPVVSVIATQAVAQYWLFDRLVGFNRAYPDAMVHIHANNAIDEYSVIEHDFGVLYGDGRWTGLKAAPLFAERIRAVAAPDLDLPPINGVADLTALPLIQLDSRAWNCLGWPSWFQHFGVAYRPPEKALTLNQVTLTLNAAQQGLGVALGWEFMTEDLLASGKLKQVGPFIYETGFHDYLVHSRSRALSPAAKVFRNWLTRSRAE